MKKQPRAVKVKAWAVLYDGTLAYANPEMSIFTHKERALKRTDKAVGDYIVPCVITSSPKRINKTKRP